MFLVGRGRLGFAAESVAYAREGLRELGRHDEHLVRGPFGELREHLQVFVAQELTVRFALVDRREDRVDRLRFTLGTEDRGLALLPPP